jgi:hypothetical protein
LTLTFRSVTIPLELYFKIKFDHIFFFQKYVTGNHQTTEMNHLPPPGEVYLCGHCRVISRVCYGIYLRDFLIFHTVIQLTLFIGFLLLSTLFTVCCRWVPRENEESAAAAAAGWFGRPKWFFFSLQL